MHCPECNTQNPERSRFCLNCSAKLSLSCPECETELPLHARFCTSCGAELSVATPDATGERVPARLDALQRLVPKEFAERLLATRGQLSKERRIVTLLFSDVKGSTAMAEQLDPEEWTEIMEGAFDVLIEPIYRYEGTVARLMGDAVLAFFGAPIAHENDPERAIRAALDIIEGAQRYAARLEKDRGIPGFNVRVGINTGLVVVGQVGSDLRVEYTAMGDAINLAARMESAAEPGTVLISEATHKLIAPLFETEPLGSVQVKGKVEPVSVFRVRAAKEVPGKVRGITGLESPLVGRDAEFALLRDCLGQLLAGRGAIVSIIGEAGVGKSRLVAEIRNSAGASHLTWLEGRTLSFGQTISYWPFQEILWQYAGISEDDSEADAWRKLERRVSALFDQKTPEVLPYLATLLTLEVRDEYAARVKYLDGEAMGRQVFLASRRFFERLGQEQPLVLVFEDLHWADESSALLLEHLLPLVERVPVLIVGVSRPYRETPAARLQEVAGQGFPDRYTEIQLAPLSQADSVQLVRNLLAIEDLPFRVREMVVRKADGNPFFLEEIIRTLMDTGAVVHEPATGRWRATAQIETITIPDTVQGVIMARVDRLEEDVKQALRTASVIGRTFLYRVLRAVAEADRQLDDHLAELQTVELIREKQRVPELEYIFKHALAQEATYESILLQKRRGLHARVGQVIENLFADRLEEFFGLLAYHYARAEEWEKAQEYLFKAGDQAGKVAADAEALAHYRQAMVAYAHAFGDRWDPLQRAVLERKLGEALSWRGEHRQALDYLQRALAHLGKALPQSRWGVRLAIVREIVQQIAHRLLPRLFLNPTDDPVSPDVEEECRLYQLNGWIAMMANLERFLLLTLRQLNVAERSGAHYWVVLGAGTIGGIADFIPLPWLAESYHRRAMALAETMQHPGALAAAYYTLVVNKAYSGEWDAVIEYCRQAAAISQEIGQLRLWAGVTEWLVVGLGYREGLAQALEQCREMVTLGQEGSDLQVQCWGLYLQGYCLLRSGLLNEAISSLQEAVELAETIPDYSTRVGAGGALGRCYLRQGALEQALRILRSSQQAYAEHSAAWGNDSELYESLIEAYLLAVEQSKGAERADWLKKARHAFRGALRRGKAARYKLPAVMRLRGTYEWLRSKPAAAFKWWQQGLGLAEEMGQTYDSGMIHLEMGQRLGDRSHLERAEAILAETGAEWDLARAREALGNAHQDE
jgi:class 3 adenylate cyclase/tetratricopeptide (TPR) repeat protein